MSHGCELFIGIEGSLEDVAAQVGAVLGFHDWDIAEGEAVTWDVTLLEHGLEGVGFPAYRYCMYIDPTRDIDLHEQARKYFAALKATNRWPLLLTYDLDEVMDRFEPEGV